MSRSLDVSADSVRVLLIGNESLAARPGGLNRYVEDLAVALAEADVGLDVLALGVEPDGARQLPDHGASLPARLWAMRRAACRLAPHIDVVDAHFALYAFLPLFTTPLRNRPLVVHFHGPWADESAVGRGQHRLTVAAKRALERAVYRRAGTVIVLSDAFARLVVDRYGVDPSRVKVVAPGVDLERFRPGDRDKARALFGLDPEAFVAVAVRRLDARMGLDVLLDAWAFVQRARPGAVLVVAGDGRERPQLDQLRHRLPDPEGVRLLGRVPDSDLADLYRAADVSVVPTRALEGFGLITLESLACGTPPVVTDVGGLPDGVKGLDPSLVIPAGETAALADRLLAAANGDAPSRRACREHAEQFAWPDVARVHIERYHVAASSRVNRGPLRVIYVGHTGLLSGGELALARMLPALNGVEPLVILAEDGPLVERLRSDGVAVEVLPMDDRLRGLPRDRIGAPSSMLSAVVATVRYTWRLRARLRQLRPDLVHTNTLKAALYGGLAGRLAGVPVVWHLRDRIAVDYLPGPAVHLIRAAARLLPAAIIANSENTLATLGPLGRRSDASVVIPSPVGPMKARISSPAGSGLTVGMVGRLAPWKGQDVFLRAFATAFSTGDSRARIVGSAMFGEHDYGAALCALASDLGIAERVEFVGFVDDVADEYSGFDVAVHASTIPEPFGQVVVEAMAAGLPVVVPDAGGPTEVVTDGVDGLLYPMGDVDSLTCRLRCLADDRELRERLGAAARRRARAFTPERVGLQVQDVYRCVLREGAEDE